MTLPFVFLRHPEPGEPTDAQKASGNYRKRKVEWNGLTISIENEGGTWRRGVAANGTEWATLLMWPYGYVNRSMGVDGDQVDVYLGPHLADAPMVYVVHQRVYGDWERYDEDKCMLGFLSEGDARDAFLACYDDPRFLGPITAMPVVEFVAKCKATKKAPSMIKAVHPVALLIKARISGYTRGDGTVVNPHEDSRPTARKRVALMSKPKAVSHDDQVMTQVEIGAGETWRGTKYFHPQKFWMSEELARATVEIHGIGKYTGVKGQRGSDGHIREISDK